MSYGIETIICPYCNHRHAVDEKNRAKQLNEYNFKYSCTSCEKLFYVKSGVHTVLHWFSSITASEKAWEEEVREQMIQRISKELKDNNKKWRQT